MKKYFLLATTALFLGTSNVMAADSDCASTGTCSANGSTSATINITGEIVAAPTIEVLHDIDFGTIYVGSYDSASTDPYATFTAIGLVANGNVYSDLEGYQGRFKVSNLPASGSVNITEEVDLGSGWYMRGIALSNAQDSNEYSVLGQLFYENAEDLDAIPSSTLSGTATITVTY